MKKKFLCTFLALSMSLAPLPMSVMAAENDTVIIQDDEADEVLTGIHNEKVTIHSKKVIVRDAQLNAGMEIAPEAAGGIVMVTGSSTVSNVVVSAEGTRVVFGSDVVADTISVEAKNAMLEISGTVKSAKIAESAEGASMAVAEVAKVGTVEVEAKDAKAEIKGTVTNVRVAESAKSASVVVAETAKVENVESKAPSASVELKGDVTNAKLEKEAEKSKLAVADTGKVKNLDIGAKDVESNLSGSVNQVTIGEGATGNVVNVSGKVDNLDIGAKDVVTNVEGSVGNVTVGEGATGNVINVSGNGEIKDGVTDKTNEVTIGGDKKDEVVVNPDKKLDSDNTNTGTTTPAQPQPVVTNIYAMIDGKKTIVGSRITQGNYVENRIDEKYNGTYKAVVTVKDGEIYAYQGVNDAVSKIANNATATITLLANETYDGTIYITDGKNITLNLGNYTLTGQLNVSGSDKNATSRKDGQPSLTINGDKDGKIVNATHAGNAITINDGGLVVLNSGTIVARNNTEAKGDEAQKQGGFGVTVFNGSQFEMSGGKIEAGWYAVSTNGTRTQGAGNYGVGAYINITGGELISHGDVAIYAPAEGTLKISGNAVVSGDAGAILARDGSIQITGGSFINLHDTTQGYTENGYQKNWEQQTDGSEAGFSGYPSIVVIPNYAGNHNGKVTVDISPNVVLGDGKLIVSNTSKTGANHYTQDQLKNLVSVSGVQATVIEIKESRQLEVKVGAGYEKGKQAKSARKAMARLVDQAREDAVELGANEYLELDTDKAAKVLKDLQSQIQQDIADEKEKGEEADYTAIPDLFALEDVRLYWTKDGDGAEYIVFMGVTKDADGNEYSLPGQSVLVTVNIPEDYQGGARKLDATITVTAKAPTTDAKTAADGIDSETVQKAIEENAQAVENAQKAADAQAAAESAVKQAQEEEEKAKEALEAAKAENSNTSGSVVEGGEEVSGSESTAESVAKAEEELKAATEKLEEAKKTAQEAQAAAKEAEEAKKDVVVAAPELTEIASGNIQVAVVLPGSEEDAGNKGDSTVGTETPSTGTDAPSTSTETSSTGSDTSAPSTETPSAGSDTSASGTETPSADSGTSTAGSGQGGDSEK